ncbi:GNAT family N-acetyltransferase [Zeaxanthinibacter enoshimensis]|uniref:RimJ/RimL family protein N-acetyltransferase n=1 Tax=Zeaxanthinibacter enoshimensis TaxID=392009 RepID=A0A4V3D451_9FLAO|nr:GNAT family protein [Zeaxanthinibacter enoshimensis]TDQ32981.1 RimJ/RimL family protein N-acetyltransferase [Zeaxanthinibacter enoshimensis]
MDLTKEIVLESSRVKLSPMKEEHLDDLLPIALKYPDLLQFSPSPFGTKPALEEYIAVALKERDTGRRYPFVILDKVSGKIAGSSSFGNISLKDKRLDIGWTWLAREVQGTGLNRHCKFLMLSYAFETLEMEKVEFRIDSRNSRSRRAVEKIGGVQEAELRSHTVMTDGYRRNTVIYGILREEWPGIKKNIFHSGNLQ